MVKYIKSVRFVNNSLLDLDGFCPRNKQKKTHTMKETKQFCGNVMKKRSQGNDQRTNKLMLHGTCIEFPYGLAVRIPGFHPGGPGSTPGMGNDNFF